MQNLRVSRKLAVVITVHLLHATILLVITAYGLKALDGSRAYVEGEGLWSKAQKDATLHLLQYADEGNESHFDIYLVEADVMLGDKQARLELEKKGPDMGQVRDGFLRGRLHPDDIDDMAWLFRTFRWEPHLDAAIDIWAQADENVTFLLVQADELHAERTSAAPDAQRLATIRDDIIATNQNLTGLEEAFSSTLGTAARYLSTVVIIGTIGLTVVFVGGALLISFLVARQLTSSLGLVRAGANRIAAGSLDSPIGLRGHDEIAGVGQSFDLLMAKLSESEKAQQASAKALRQSEERFRSLADAASEGIIVHDGGRVVDSNKAAARIFGYLEGELEGKPIMDLVAPRFQAVVQAHVATASPEAYEVVAMRKGGEEFPLEATGKNFAWGTGMARVVTLRDMTPQRQIERQFQDLVEAAPDAMVIVDRQSRIMIVNAETERLFGYARDEMVGQPVEILVPEDKRGPHVGQRDGYIAHPVRRPMGKGRALHARRKDGSTFPAEISLSPVGSGDNMRVIATVRDTSGRLAIERERLEADGRRRQLEALQEADRVKTTFINAAAHELRTPLLPLRVQIHVLLNGAPREDQRAPLEIAQRNLKRLSTLVEDLLLVSKAQAGHLVIKPANADLRKLVTETVATYTEVARERGIVLQVGDLVAERVHMDEVRVAQVLDNFLANAMKFTHKGGRVTVGMEDRHPAVRVSVTDTGIGISTEDQGRLFQPFVQVHEGTEVSDPGTGLGLYIGRQIIELHGGLLGVSSPGEGQGATFWFQLPKSGPGDGDAAPSDLSPNRARHHGGGL